METRAVDRLVHGRRRGLQPRPSGPQHMTGAPPEGPWPASCSGSGRGDRRLPLPRGPGRRLHRTLGHRGAARWLPAPLRRAGIARSVLFPAFHSDYAVANREIARMVRARPDRFYGFAFVTPADRGRIRALIREAVDLGLAASRCTGTMPASPAKSARPPGFRCPCSTTSMGETAPAELLARRVPDVDFIIPHLGSFADDWAAQAALIRCWRAPQSLHRHLRRAPFRSAGRAVRAAGAAKVLFGSDGPWLHPGRRARRKYGCWGSTPTTSAGARRKRAAPDRAGGGGGRGERSVRAPFTTPRDRPRQ